MNRLDRKAIDRDWESDKAHIEASVLERFHLLNGGHVLQIEIHPGIELAKREHDGWNHLRGCGSDKADADVPNLS